MESGRVSNPLLRAGSTSAAVNVVIETACVEDAAAIAAVHVASLRVAYRGQIPDHLVHLVVDPLDVEKRTRGWQGWLERAQTSTVVGRDHGRVAGFCTLHPMPVEAARGVTGEIAAIYVMPSHWRRGIGRRLCETTLAEAGTRRFAEVVVWVLESNERARHFYRSLGFRTDGETRVFLESSGASLHELRLRRNTSLAVV